MQGARSRRPVCNPGRKHETGGFAMRNKKMDENKKSEIAERKIKEMSHV
jgi:hypothetical protein